MLERKASSVASWEAQPLRATSKAAEKEAEQVEIGRGLMEGNGINHKPNFKRKLKLGKRAWRGLARGWGGGVPNGIRDESAKIPPVQALSRSTLQDARHAPPLPFGASPMNFAPTAYSISRLAALTTLAIVAPAMAQIVVWDAGPVEAPGPSA